MIFGMLNPSKIWHENFFQDLTYQKLLKSVNLEIFNGVIQKNKRCTFWGHSVGFCKGWTKVERRRRAGWGAEEGGCAPSPENFSMSERKWRVPVHSVALFLKLKWLQGNASKLIFCIHRENLLQYDNSRHVGVYCGLQSCPFACCVPTSMLAR